MDREEKISEQEARNLIGQLSREEKLALRELLKQLNRERQKQAS